MQEIGGYLELEQFVGTEYHPNALRFNTAKSALLWLMEKRRVRRIWLPEYLCPSVQAAIEKNQKYTVLHYPVTKELTAELPKEIEPDDMLYLVNYYGQLSSQQIVRQKEKTPRMIVDNVQAFFEKPVAGVDTLYSCRKWFGVPDGAYLYANGLQTEELSPESAAGRFAHLLGRYEGTASEWYAAYRENEKWLDERPIHGMSLLARNLLCGVDYAAVKKRRTENFERMHRILRAINRLDLTVPRGAFMYPLYLEGFDTTAVRRDLVGKGIYIPMLWPGLTGLASELSEKILPLPIDQRYGAAEINYLQDNLRTALIKNRKTGDCR